MLTAQWNLGDEAWFWISVPLMGLLLLVFLPALVLWLKAMVTQDTAYEGTISGPVALIAGIVLVIVGGVSALVFWPFQTQYMQYKQVSGIVQQAPSSRFLSDGSGGTSQNYLVVIRGQDYRCDDTRCSQLRKGEAVTLMCERQWQANGTPGYVCNWGKLGLNT